MWIKLMSMVFALAAMYAAYTTRAALATMQIPDDHPIPNDMVRKDDLLGDGLSIVLICCYS
jgi:hypothetical protein